MSNRRDCYFWWERDPIGNWRPMTTDRGDPTRWLEPRPAVGKQRITVEQHSLGVVKLAKMFPAPVQLQREFNRPRR